MWWGNRSIIDTVLALDVQRRPRIWLDIGTNEGGNPRKIVEDVRILRDALAKKGWQQGADLNYNEVEGAEHNEAAWRDRFGSVLRYLFPAQS